MHLTYRLVSLGTVMAGTALAASPAGAQTMDVGVTLPRLPVAEYHKPYVAIWLEKAGAPARTLAVWYDLGKRDNAGAKWLRDVRMWWRASGRSLALPADGISGATRGPGANRASFSAGRGGMPALTAGAYTLVVEAAREAGGRELVRVPFTVNAAGTARGSATGTNELGAVTVAVHR